MNKIQEKKKRSHAARQIHRTNDYTAQALRAGDRALVDLRVAMMLLRGSQPPGPRGQAVSRAPMPCPFCGKTPSGTRFCSTPHGPALSCDYCRGEGPPALLDQEYVYGGRSADKRLNKIAIQKWNDRGGFLRWNDKKWGHR